MSGGTVTAGNDNYFNGAILNMLAGAGTVTSTTLAGSNGTLDFNTGWTGSYTANNYSSTDWETLFSALGDGAGVFATLNGSSLSSAQFNAAFQVTNNGATLSLLPPTIPEPSSLLLASLGLIGLGLIRRRRRS